MESVFLRSGDVIMIMIVEMDQMNTVQVRTIPIYITLTQSLIAVWSLS